MDIKSAIIEGSEGNKEHIIRNSYVENSYIENSIGNELG